LGETVISTEPTRGRSMMMPVTDQRHAWFIRLWGVAALAHVVANWQQPGVPTVLGGLLVAAGLLGASLVIRPGRWRMLALTAVIPLSAALEIPELGNHWMVAALVSLAYLATGGVWARFDPAGRAVLIAFYAFAAFAKLNEGFFSPATSCSTFYANQWLAGLGLGPLSGGETALIVATAAIELSVPILLLLRPTRGAGVVLATAFHTFISWDLNQHFYDFTAVLLPLFALFLPLLAFDRLSASRMVPSRLLGRALAVVFGLAALAMVAAATFANFPASDFLLLELPFYLWIPFSIWWLVAVVRFGRTAPAAASLAWKMSVAGAAVVAITVLNGLTPYLEVKTAFGFNMYANLVTAQGATNHFIVPATLPIRDGYDRPVEIVSSSDPALLYYPRYGYLVAWPQFRIYVADHPGIEVSYRRGSESFEYPGSDGELSEPVPWWWRWLPLRAIDTQSPPRCQDVFLPAL
jgi:hypothetical protein